MDLPAIATKDEKIALPAGRFWQRREGRELWPEREPLATLEELRREIGHAAFSAQYQQDPTPPGGNRAKWSWFLRFKETFTRADFTWMVQSWDTAMTGEPSSDYSVGTSWGWRNGKWHLVDLVRERLDFTDLKRRVRSFADRWQADQVLIEKAGSGFGLLDQLRQEDRRDRYRLVQVTTDKISRFEAQTAYMEAGGYVLPEEAPWLEEFKRELLAFPTGKFDDQVDSLVQFIAWDHERRGGDLLRQTDPITGRRDPIRRDALRHPFAR